MTTEHLGASRIDGPDACSKILLVGEANPYGADRRYALYHEPDNAAGGRLQRKILGIDARRWYLPMWRTNLCTGDFSMDEATTRAGSLLTAGAPWDIVVMLGRKVAIAFSLPVHSVALKPFGRAATTSMKTFTTLALPHPSGRNAASWTRPDVLRAREILSTMAPGIPWGELDTTGAP